MQPFTEDPPPYTPPAPGCHFPGALPPEVGQLPVRPNMASLSQSRHLTMFDARQPRAQAMLFFRDGDSYYSWQSAYMKAVTDLTEQVKHLDTILQNLQSRVCAVENRTMTRTRRFSAEFRPATPRALSLDSVVPAPPSSP